MSESDKKAPIYRKHWSDEDVRALIRDELQSPPFKELVRAIVNTTLAQADPPRYPEVVMTPEHLTEHKAPSRGARFLKFLRGS